MAGSIQSKQSIGKAAAGFVIITLLPIAIIFLSAGRTDWWEAWAMIGMIVIATIISRILLLKKHPDLVRERAKWAETDSGVPAWDKKLMPLVAVYGPMLVWLAAGLDKRWGATPPLPPALELCAFALVAMGYLLGIWAMLANRFFSAMARIQKDRDQVVIDSGPYRIIRHPGYAAGVAGFLATPLALGTLWAYVPAVAVILATIARTALEDSMLRAELPGYAEYAGRTRYRLVPGVW